jgi:hypothetical protein
MDNVAMDAQYIADSLTRWFTHKNGGILVDFTAAWVKENGRWGVIISWVGGPSEKEVKDWAILAGVLTGDMAFAHCHRSDTVVRFPS